MVKLPVRFLKINNDVAIWSAPVELFCEISNEVRERSPFPFTFYFGYTNGWLGYLPTEEEYKHGGYEVDVVSPYTPVTGRELTESVTAYLQGEMRSVSLRQGKRKEALIKSKSLPFLSLIFTCSTLAFLYCYSLFVRNASRLAICSFDTEASSPTGIADASAVSIILMSALEMVIR